MKQVFAHTEASSQPYPAYVNVAIDERGILLTTRSRGQTHGAAMLLTPEQAREMASKILAELDSAQPTAGPVPTTPR